MSKVDLVISGGKVFFNNSFLDGGVAVQDGEIVAVAKDGRLPRGEERVNVRERILCPGLIDSHVHLRDMNYRYKEDFRSGTLAAAAGGFTTVLDMPNTLPVTDSLLRLSDKIERAKNNLYVNVGLYLALTAKTEFRALPLCVGLKAYLYSSMEELEVDPEVVRGAAAKLPPRYPLAVHAENRMLIRDLYARSMNRGMNGVESFLYSHPPEAEVQSVREMTKVVPRETLLHFCHVSVAECLSVIGGSARSVSIEVTPHHLFLSSRAVRRLGPVALSNPPLREPHNPQGLMKALRDGLIDIVASDHAPHTMEEKKSETPPPGVPGLETTLPLMLSAVERRSIGLATLIRALSSKPAEIFGLKRRGQLQVGSVADLTVIDLKRHWTIDSSRFFSKAKYSPFDKLKVRGGSWATFVGGKLIVQDGEVVTQPGTGTILSSGRSQI